MYLGSLPPQQGMPGGQPMPPAGLRPPMPGSQPMPPAGLRSPMPGSQPMQYNQQRGPVPSTDTSHAHNLSNGDQNTSRSISRETTEAEKEVNFSFFTIC